MFVYVERKFFVFFEKIIRTPQIDLEIFYAGKMFALVLVLKIL